MKCFYITLTLLIVGLLAFSVPAFSEGHVGASWTETGAGDNSIGLLGNYGRSIGHRVQIDAEGSLQKSNMLTTDGRVDLTVAVGAIGIRPYISFTGKGASLDVVGGNVDGGLR